MTLITIRREQLEKMRLDRVEQYVRTMFDSIRMEYAQATANIDDPTLFAWLVQTIERAQGYGLHYDHDIQAFVALALTISPWFDDYPPFKSILTDPELGNDERMAALFRLVEDADIETAGRMPARD
jgi:hypothetical protein